jgi:hypothetical protein
MHLWPNIIGYLLISWPILFLYKVMLLWWLRMFKLFDNTQSVNF